MSTPTCQRRPDMARHCRSSERNHGTFWLPYYSQNHQLSSCSVSIQISLLPNMIPEVCSAEGFDTTEYLQIRDVLVAAFPRIDPSFITAACFSGSGPHAELGMHLKACQVAGLWVNGTCCGGAVLTSAQLNTNKSPLPRRCVQVRPAVTLCKLNVPLPLHSYNVLGCPASCSAACPAACPAACRAQSCSCMRGYTTSTSRSTHDSSLFMLKQRVHHITVPG